MPCDAASTPSAPNSASTMHCEVSTLPATTAAGGTGFSIEPRVDADCERPQAALVQREVGVDQRAEHVEHGRGADRERRVEIAGLLRRRAGEVDDGAPRLSRSTRDRDLDRAAVVHLVAQAAVAEAADDFAHAGLGVVLDVAHVAHDRVAARARDQRLELGDAARVGGELRLEVGDILVGIARGPGAGGEALAQRLLADLAAVEQQEVVEQHAFLRRSCARRAASSPA